MLLATVKGDVHDIGKNLVEIILKNNGYDVINLGIKVPPEDLIKAWREHSPDAIGLSGLLVKSAQQMVITATDLREAGVRVPLLVGGAALSEKFTRQKIAPQYATAVCYAKDAMTGLRLMNELSDSASRESTLADHTFTDAAPPEPRAPQPIVPHEVKSAPHPRFAPTCCDSAGRLSRAQGSQHHQPSGNLELREFLHALRTPSRLSWQF